VDLQRNAAPRYAARRNGGSLMRTAVPLGALALLLAPAGEAVRGADAADRSSDLAREAGSLRAVCGKCHNLEIVMNTPRSLEDWRDTMQKMVDRGASGTDDQYDDILDYLHRTMTTIDVNSADADELAAVLGAPDSAVKLIIARRSARRFADMADLKSIPGLDAAALDAKSRLIYFR
jgi:competence protein ComEA